eukprot:1736011-Alexandrium_andersonii.AAC.1
MSASLVGSEMCIRDRPSNSNAAGQRPFLEATHHLSSSGWPSRGGGVAEGAVAPAGADSPFVGTRSRSLQWL